MTEVQQTFERLVSLAIQREEEAYDFYMKAAEQSKFKSSTKLLLAVLTHGVILLMT